LVNLFDCWLERVNLVIDEFRNLGLRNGLSFLHDPHNACLNDDGIISLGQGLYLLHIGLFFLDHLERSMVFIIDLVSLVHLVQYKYVALVQHIDDFGYDALTALQYLDQLVFLHGSK
jgi:hypothetical protein